MNTTVKVVVMGVSGSGKTTVGTLLAERLGVEYRDGDDLHSQANIEKMASGIPLNDDDRWPWLAQVGEWLAAQPAGGVIGCSALKRSYRDVLRRDGVCARAWFPRGAVGAFESSRGTFYAGVIVGFAVCYVAAFGK